MREYGKIAPQLWIGSTGKSLRGSLEAQVVAAYLLSSPHANMLGLYYLPLAYIAHDTGIPFEGASKGLQRVIEAGFCRYDEDAEVVWVVNMAFYQIAESLSATDNRVKNIQSEYDKLPNNKYLDDFFDLYSGPFKIKIRREIERGSEAPSKPLRSQEQEQEQEKDKNKPHTPPADADGDGAPDGESGELASEGALVSEAPDGPSEPPAAPQGATTTLVRPLEPRKRGRRSPRQGTIDRFQAQAIPGDVIEVASRIFEAWPKADPDGRAIGSDFNLLVPRLHELVEAHAPHLTLDLLEAAAMDYLGYTAKHRKAPQFFFGSQPAPGSDKPLWRSYAEAAYTKRQIAMARAPEEAQV
jgi:hypothetical protein